LLAQPAGKYEVRKILKKDELILRWIPQIQDESQSASAERREQGVDPQIDPHFWLLNRKPNGGHNVKPSLVSYSNRISHKALCRSMPVRLAALGLAVAFTASQNPAQNLRGSDSAAPAQAATNSHTVPAGTATSDVSAPVPNLQEATVVKPFSDSLFSLAAAQDGQSSSSSASNVMAAPAAKKPNPPHHALGRALSDIGIGALASGIILFAAESHYCGSNTKPTDCSEARDAGIALMPAGGALMVTGFVLRFHR